MHCTGFTLTVCSADTLPLALIVVNEVAVDDDDDDGAASLLLLGASASDGCSPPLMMARVLFICVFLCCLAIFDEDYDKEANVHMYIINNCRFTVRNEEKKGKREIRAVLFCYFCQF